MPSLLFFTPPSFRSFSSNHSCKRCPSEGRRSSAFCMRVQMKPFFTLTCTCRHHCEHHNRPPRSHTHTRTHQSTTRSPMRTYGTRRGTQDCYSCQFSWPEWQGGAGDCMACQNGKQSLHFICLRAETSFHESHVMCALAAPNYNQPSV